MTDNINICFDQIYFVLFGSNLSWTAINLKIGVILKKLITKYIDCLKVGFVIMLKTNIWTWFPIIKRQ